MSKRMLRVVALCVLAAPLSTQALALAEEAYEIDAAHTHIQFEVMRFGYAKTIATFRSVSGVISLNMEQPGQSSVVAEVDVASLESGDPTRDEHLQGEFWFKTAEFPTMRFASTKVEQTGEDRLVVTGDLTLLGVTRPVALDVVMNKVGQDPATKSSAAGFSATASVKRSDFGMNTAIPLVGDDVEIRIETLAHQKKE